MSSRKQKVAKQSVLLPKRAVPAKSVMAAQARNEANGSPSQAVSQGALPISGPGQALLRLQRRYGNQHVQKLLARTEALRSAEKDEKKAQLTSEDEKKTLQTQPEEEKEVAQTKAEEDPLQRQPSPEEKQQETPV